MLVTFKNFVINKMCGLKLKHRNVTTRLRDFMGGGGGLLSSPFMNQFGFLHLILQYGWPTSMFLKNTSLCIGVKFFHSEMPQSITLGTDSSPVISLCLSPVRGQGMWWEGGKQGTIAQRRKDEWGWVSLRNTMKQDWLNNCMLVYCHKTLADAKSV